jgi:hypothetical protein
MAEDQPSAAGRRAGDWSLEPAVECRGHRLDFPLPLAVERADVRDVGLLEPSCLEICALPMPAAVPAHDPTAPVLDLEHPHARRSDDEHVDIQALAHQQVADDEVVGRQPCVQRVDE